ncbi:MAG TPA: GspH/FimT family pseudopilin [Xanthomonadales bacterium]|nr:GspH/FimT family pseudopilin [Xanthomonadales bacterium]
MNPQRTTLPQSTFNGFTGLELLMVVAIAAILLVLGVPALQDFGLRQRMSAAMNALHTQLELARHEAIHLNAYVVVCPGDGSVGCSGINDWSRGWIVFSDSNGDRQYQPDQDSLQRSEAGLEQIQVQSNSGRSNLRFYPNGSAPGSNTSITFCDIRGPEQARKLVISNLGRIRRDEAPETDALYCPSGDA